MIEIRRILSCEGVRHNHERVVTQVCACKDGALVGGDVLFVVVQVTGSGVVSIAHGVMVL